MHHKRHKPKNCRAGCLLCKPHKANGYSKEKASKFSILKKIKKAKEEIKIFLEGR